MTAHRFDGRRQADIVEETILALGPHTATIDEISKALDRINVRFDMQMVSRIRTRLRLLHPKPTETPMANPFNPPKVSFKPTLPAPKPIIAIAPKTPAPAPVPPPKPEAPAPAEPPKKPRTKWRHDSPEVIDAVALVLAGEVQREVAEAMGIPNSSLGGWVTKAREKAARQAQREEAAKAKAKASAAPQTKPAPAKADANAVIENLLARGYRLVVMPDGSLEVKK